MGTMYANPSFSGNGHMSTSGAGCELSGILLSIINFKFAYSIAPAPVLFFFS